ncbi:hypothetical protein [Flavobacterium psychrotrophum]|uniref:hypothetical protein n=1 Tax=Flavobacterium psychrotrophum TaxID=2294119 RepID=UPI000E314243|nr:hypothetical protein [Flavobacterium psychrotrophum]
MKLKALTYSLIALVAISCSDDPEGNSLNGSWKLTNATVTDGPSLEYETGEVMWTFNENAKTLVVQNNIKTAGPENIMSGLPTGFYDYTIINEANKSYLYVEGHEQGAFANTGSNLVISTDPDNIKNLTKVFKR